jgi:hypothetical protein
MAFPGRSSSGFSAAIKKAPETLRFQAPLPVLCGAYVAPDYPLPTEGFDKLLRSAIARWNHPQNAHVQLVHCAFSADSALPGHRSLRL